MYITVHSAHEVTFEDRHDFRSFKVVVGMANAHLHDVRVALSKVAMLPDRNTAWVSADALRHWPGVKHDARLAEGLQHDDREGPAAWAGSTKRMERSGPMWSGRAERRVRSVNQGGGTYA